MVFEKISNKKQKKSNINLGNNGNNDNNNKIEGNHNKYINCNDGATMLMLNNKNSNKKQFLNSNEYHKIK